MENFFLNKYNCTLPLTTDGLHKRCPIFDKSRNDSFVEMIQVEAFLNIIENSMNMCPNEPKCKRSNYEMKQVDKLLKKPPVGWLVPS